VTGAAPQLARIDGVQLMRTGTWDASTGRIKVTPDDLAAIVAAAADRVVDRAPIKIGHRDDRFQGPDGEPPAREGEPAYGWVENLRLADGGNTLIGDLVGIPGKLAAIIPAAFRRRSVEIAYGLRTVAGKVYRAVLTGLALLGQSAPAVKGLDDVLALYSADTDGLPGGFTALLVADSDTTNIPPAAVSPVDSGSEAARRTTKENGMDPKLIRQALGLAADATDEQVREAVATAGLATPAAPAGPAAPSGQTPAAAPSAPAAPAGPEGQAPQTPAAQTAPAPAAGQAPAGPAAEQPQAAQPATPAGPVQAAAGDGHSPAGAPTATVTVDAAMFGELQRNAQFGREAREQQIRERRDALVNTALAEGRIHPTVVAQYRAMLDTDEAGTSALLRVLPQVVPVGELGHQQFAAPPSDDAAVKAAVASFVGIGV